eukprot:2964868-Alexandrium_andersonii.AAC.1
MAKEHAVSLAAEGFDASCSHYLDANGSVQEMPAQFQASKRPTRRLRGKTPREEALADRAPALPV